MDDDIIFDMRRFFLLMWFPLLSLTTGLFPSERLGFRPANSLPKNNAAMGLFLTTATPTPIITSTPLESGEVYHVVQAHEALWSIAIAYNTSIEHLKLLNGLSTDEIFEGQKLLVFKPEPETATPTNTVTVTLGIPTSTATKPITPTFTSTTTPLPMPPSTLQGGGVVLGLIVLIALLAAGLGSWLGRKRAD
ncbi:MAG: LysM peptidoglycan-binding domain-containing protein [Chloroflexi bacterium]|nr:LysM peptidoglycan-binding domain-containing protein [Chloroflexota bacterium]